MVQYPQRIGEPDCRDFLRTGRCKYGESCKYHHPSNVESGGGIKTPLNPSEPPFPIRPNEPACQYFLKHGTCKFGQQCKFHHPVALVGKDGRGGSGVVVTSSSTTLVTASQAGENNNAIILPQRPKEPDCIYFLRNGRCKYGAGCKYHHPLTYHNLILESSNAATSSSAGGSPPQYQNRSSVPPSVCVPIRPSPRGRSYSTGSFIEVQQQQQQHDSTATPALITGSGSSGNTNTIHIPYVRNQAGSGGGNSTATTTSAAPVHIFFTEGPVAVMVEQPISAASSHLKASSYYTATNQPPLHPGQQHQQQQTPSTPSTTQPSIIPSSSPSTLASSYETTSSFEYNAASVLPRSETSAFHTRRHYHMHPNKNMSSPATDMSAMLPQQQPMQVQTSLSSHRRLNVRSTRSSSLGSTAELSYSHPEEYGIQSWHGMPASQRYDARSTIHRPNVTTTTTRMSHNSSTLRHHHDARRGRGDSGSGVIPEDVNWDDGFSQMTSALLHMLDTPEFSGKDDTATATSDDIGYAATPQRSNLNNFSETMIQESRPQSNQNSEINIAMSQASTATRQQHLHSATTLAYSHNHHHHSEPALQTLENNHYCYQYAPSIDMLPPASFNQSSLSPPPPTYQHVNTYKKSSCLKDDDKISKALSPPTSSLRMNQGTITTDEQLGTNTYNTTPSTPPKWPPRDARRIVGGNTTSPHIMPPQPATKTTPHTKSSRHHVGLYLP